MNNVENFKSLLGNHWLTSVLNSSELQKLVENSTKVSYRKRETVIKKGAFANHLLFLMDGFVKIESDEGVTNYIFDIASGMRFIGAPLILSSDKNIFSVVTLTDAEIVFIPVEIFRDLLSTNCQFSMAMLNHCNDTFVMPLLEKLKFGSRSSIKSRLARLLVELVTVTHKSQSFTLLVNRSEMAEMIGFSRENVIRMLSEFSSEGIIKLSGKSFTVLDMERLEKLVE